MDKSISKKEHTANFIVSSFLSSKRSLRKIYGLNAAMIAILRYIIDSIDTNYRKRKQFNTRLYQTQIATYCHISDRKTVRKHLKNLHRKRFLIYEEEKHMFFIGKTLIAWANITYPQDMGKNSPWVRYGEKFPTERYGEKFPTSNSSNFTNKSLNFLKPKNLEKQYEPAPSGKHVSSLLAEFESKLKNKENI